MTDTPDPGEPGVRMACGVFGGLALLAAIPAVFAAFIAIFFFDAPGSGGNPYTLALAFGCWAAPFVCVASAVFAFRAAIRFTRAKIVTALALPLALIAYLAVAYTLFDRVCAGKFAC